MSGRCRCSLELLLRRVLRRFLLTTDTFLDRDRLNHRSATLPHLGKRRCLPGALALFCLLFSVFPALCADVPTPFEADRLTGSPAPDFALRDLEGRIVSLSALKGKVVLLNFWGAWSPPSRDELPALDKIRRLLDRRGLEVLAVSTDARPHLVNDSLKERPVRFPVVFEGGRALSRSSYKVFVVPTTFIIGRDGTIVGRHFGARKWDSPGVVKELESLL